MTAFFASTCELLQPDGLNAETRAFVRGYVSHLVMDEQYITGIYRPYFARHDALGGRDSGKRDGPPAAVRPRPARTATTRS